MIQHARRAVQTNHNAYDQEGGRDDAERVFVREPDGEDRGGEFPCRGVEGVGEPVGY